MEKRKLSVLVAGQRFNLITDEEEKYVIDVASKVDAKITSISISSNMSRERAAVLTALDLADDGEKNKREMAAVREQVKDYLAQVEALTAENTALKSEASKAQLNEEALKDARATIAAGEKEKEALKKQIFALKEQIELMQQIQSAPAPAEEPAKAEPAPAAEQPAPAEEPILLEPAPAEEPAPPAEQPKAVTAEDDLFFDVPEEEPVRPASRKEKKNRHDHSHVNPYKQQFMQKQEQKGYTQQRQYSLFEELDEQ